MTDAPTPLDRERIYRGETLVFRGLPAMIALAARAREMACEAFDPHAPPEAQRSLDPEQFRARAAALRRSFMHDPRVRALFRAVIESLGLDPADTYADRLILRLQPGGDSPPRTAHAGSAGAPRHLGFQRHGPDQPVGAGVSGRSGTPPW